MHGEQISKKRKKKNRLCVTCITIEEHAHIALTKLSTKALGNPFSLKTTISNITDILTGDPTKNNPID